MKIASWNVRTLLDRDGTNRPERRSALVAAELQRYEIDVAGLQETRFSGSGQLEKAIILSFGAGVPKGAPAEWRGTRYQKLADQHNGVSTNCCI